MNTNLSHSAFAFKRWWHLFGQGGRRFLDRGGGICWERGHGISWERGVAGVESEG